MEMIDDNNINKNMLLKMLSIIPDMISIHDTEFNILYSNWNGFGDIDKEKRKLYTKCYKTYRNNDDICNDCWMIKALKNKKSYENQIKLPENIWLEFKVIPILDNNGNVEMILEWVKDITEQKISEEIIHKMNRDLERTNKELKIANEAKTAFLATVSHELRTPMNGIVGGVFLMNRSEDIQQIKEYRKLIEESIERLMPIIDDILNVSNNEIIYLEYKDEIEINDFLNEEIRKFEITANRKKLNFLINNKIEEKTLLKTDKNRLSQILNRIIKNAIEYTEKGKVEITTETEDLENNKINLRIEVKDTGIGIKKEYYNKVFEPFEQQENYLTRKHQGLGLGLSIAKDLIEKMGGEITFESEEGKGTTFYINIKLDKVLSQQEAIEEKNY